MEKTKKKESQNTTAANTLNDSPIKRSIAGGLIGATVGYLAAPENRKKIMENISPDKLKSTGMDLGQAVKEKTMKAAGSIKDSAGNLFNKEDVLTEGYANEQDETAESETYLKSDSNENSTNDNDVPHKESKISNDQLEEILLKLIQERKDQSQGQKEKQVNDESNEAIPSTQLNDEQAESQSKEARLQSEDENDSNESQSFISQNSLNNKAAQSHSEGQEESAKNETDQQSTDNDYESLKTENEHLQNRLGKIEEMLTTLMQEKSNDRQESTSEQKEDELKEEDLQENESAEKKKQALTDKEERPNQDDKEEKSEGVTSQQDDKKEEKEKKEGSSNTKKQSSSDKTSKPVSQAEEAYNVLSDDQDTYLLLNKLRKEM
ncbi:hypothetical protein AC623_19425 [Bacillus sp. FJAT-27231]|uniref:YtxH domain-containing protein n=1 Tax=Bacillus sp. FJAT-27231 TaxID=1679168 RepID=UPI00067146C7|nr:YtxH domain-containing protein [Bacillus sp. FJAT-27231]KMY55840.1 hypothetical protein AC623_19425 [Bacillus sp. FJAT-27231]